MTIAPDRPGTDLGGIARLPYDDPAWAGIRRARLLLDDAEYTALAAGHARALTDAADGHLSMPQLDMEAHRRRGLAPVESGSDDEWAVTVSADARGYSLAVDEMHAARWERRHQEEVDGDE
jgi:hypothetical protein